MNKSKTISCFLVGDELLVVRCAEVLLQNNHRILGIISSNPKVREWAKEQGIEQLSLDKQLATRLSDTPFDFLFSIANLSILPIEAISLARRFAVNFHDGPLPRYAGLNAPSWAILNGERDYAISWHIMTDKVDEGDILKQRKVSISDNDTSFTLNAKCHDAALASFAELVDELTTTTETRTKQDLSQRTFFSRDKRPYATGLIDWNQSAQQISALVRALDFGPYLNPLNVAKILIGDEPAAVSSIDILDSASGNPPGTVVAITNNSMQVTTKTQDVVLSNIRPLPGNKGNFTELTSLAEIQTGQQLGSLNSDQLSHLNKLAGDIAKHEPFWVNRLNLQDKIEIPFAEHSLQREKNQKSKLFEVPQSALLYFQDRKNGADQLMAGLLLYISRITSMTEFNVDFRYPHFFENFSRFDSFFYPSVPLQVKFDYKQPFSNCVEAIEHEINLTTVKKGYSRDLVLRKPELRAQFEQNPEKTSPILIDRTNQLVGELKDYNAELTFVIPNNGTQCLWVYDNTIYSEEAINQMQAQFAALLNDINISQSPVAELSILPPQQRQALLVDMNATAVDGPVNQTIHQLFEQQANKTPNATALVFREEKISYTELNQRANQLTHYLTDKGVSQGSLVGVMMDRSIEMIATMMAILKSGSAYVPLDPAYPKERLNFIVNDAHLTAVITEQKHAELISSTDTDVIILENIDLEQNTLKTSNPEIAVSPDSLAYVIYTSGSTGNPKGVMVEHRNVVNFFNGMDERVGADKPGVWLAVTSISFDISVLELFWTLARGFKVVLYKDDYRHHSGQTIASRYPNQAMDFSLFYWNIVTEQNIHDQEKYRLLMESARFGDENGFSAVWTPERHFASFGGLYPNPSVISAALAVQTKRIRIHAGSCVLPLHSPIRAAEEWAVVDNLSNGRVGLGIAAGWQPNDFVIKPENHGDAKNIMFDSLETLIKLWRGESVPFNGPNGDVDIQTLPRPIQEELPVWITVAGNPDTFKKAGEIGANVLTHLLGQSIEQVAENIALYRQTRKQHGHKGEGQVTLLLHTLVGDDYETVKQLAREPMKEYLKSAVFLVKNAAWHFPTFKALSDETGKSLDEYFATISEDDLDAVLEFAFERYFTTSGLFGTPESCMEMVDKLKEIGVNEIGCLIDFGIATDKVLNHLPNLNNLRQIAGITEQTEVEKEYTIPSLIAEHGVTHFQCTPSMASMLSNQPEAQNAFASLQCMMLGGEALPPKIANDLSTVISGKLINMYGPTETTIWSTTEQINSSDVTIGRPIVNTQIYVLDQNMQPVPIGVAGELYIGGSGVTRGYLHREELTKERFISNPFIKGNSQRIYKTGDLVRYRPDGKLQYIGRTDFQVKLRGFRIELGEIETPLAQHNDVRDCVVVVREDTPGDQRLVAYVVLKDEHTVGRDQLRSHLRETLPEHMIPSNFVFLNKLPLTPNGKTDRKALPIPELSTSESIHRFEAPQTVMEKTIAGLWSEVLGLENIGIHDHFFNIGGHSLLAAQLITRLRKTFAIELPLRAIFETPTIAGLAQHLTELVDQTEQSDKSIDDYATVIEPAIVKQPFCSKPPLSYGQQRLWFLDRLEPGSHYNDAYALHLNGEINIDVLEKSINTIIARHEVLRTYFKATDGEPYQAINPDLCVKLPLIDLRNTPMEQCHAKAQMLITETIGHPIDLSNGPVLSTTIYQLGENEYLFLLVIHQIANDSWSLGVFMGELWSLYEAFSANRESPLPELEIQYSDYARWQREWLSNDTIDKELQYWKQKLAGEIAILDLPTDYPRPPVQTFKGARHFVKFSDDIVTGLKKLSSQHGCTPFITLLAVFNVLLARYSGQNDIVIGAPIANRDHQEIEPLIGMFINTLVLRTDLSGAPSFAELLNTVRQTTTEAYDHANVPFERLVESLQPERDLSRTPLFQVMFDYQNTPLNLPKILGLSMQPESIESHMSRFDLTLELTESANGIKGHWEYNTDLFSAKRIERMAQHFQNLLSAVIDDANMPASTLPLLSQEERTQLLYEWNNTSKDFPSNKSIHQLFEQQVAKTPNKVALIINDEVISYQQLNAQANRLANYLRENGICDNISIGICIERSASMVVAMLGILKAGASYLPLDPSYPKDRIAYMLQDSQTSLVITENSVEVLSELGIQSISLGETIDSSDQDINIEADTNNLCYMIYTSGSTGKPKGVEVPHCTVVNFLNSMQHDPGICADDVLLAVTTISFDISVLEIFLPLISGATVVIADKNTTTDGRQLLDLINKTNTNIMQATPATWRLLLAANWQGSNNFKALCGGEAMPPELIRELQPLAGGGLWNMYGPTETTVWSSCYRLTTPHDKALIGRPIDNTHIYVLDKYLQPLPIGIPGEIYIGGSGVVRGYHQRPELTEERFIADPFTGNNSARMYRTGDLGCFCEDGKLQYLRRMDNQVKVRGFRIELGEIESSLVAHAAVRQCVVIVHQESDADARLVAYIVYEKGHHATVSDLRRFLKKQLPEYMVPVMYIDIPSIPLTPSGKVNRKALPNPFHQRTAANRHAPPRTDAEKSIAAIWCDALKLDKVSRHDNFFDLGGHSLLSMQVIARIEKETGHSVGPRAMVMDTLEQIAVTCTKEPEDKLLAEERVTQQKYSKNIIKKIRDIFSHP